MFQITPFKKNLHLFYYYFLPSFLHVPFEIFSFQNEVEIRILKI